MDEKLASVNVEPFAYACPYSTENGKCTFLFWAVGKKKYCAMAKLKKAWER